MDDLNSQFCAFNHFLKVRIRVLRKFQHLYFPRNLDLADYRLDSRLPEIQKVHEEPYNESYVSLSQHSKQNCIHFAPFHLLRHHHHYDHQRPHLKLANSVS